MLIHCRVKLACVGFYKPRHHRQNPCTLKSICRLEVSPGSHGRTWRIAKVNVPRLDAVTQNRSSPSPPSSTKPAQVSAPSPSALVHLVTLTPSLVPHGSHKKPLQPSVGSRKSPIPPTGILASFTFSFMTVDMMFPFAVTIELLHGEHAYKIPCSCSRYQ